MISQEKRGTSQKKEKEARCFIKPALSHIQSAASTVRTKMRRKVCWPVYMLNNKKEEILPSAPICNRI